MQSTQLSLGLQQLAMPSLEALAAVKHMAVCAEDSARGAVFTRREVVEFILDLIGYTKDQPLNERRLLEPSFGGGDFLFPIITQLLEAWRDRKPSGDELADLSDAIRAVELHYDSYVKTRITRRPNVDASTLTSLAESLVAEDLPMGKGAICELTQVANGTDPWLLESTNHVSLIRRLERCFPTLEEVGCKVGIGVATGADKAFIGDFESLDVEANRKLPLVTTKDVASGHVEWQGKGVINPFSESGGLVDLTHYPRLRHYLETHREMIAARHCAKKVPKNWYRTIDRINPELSATRKLLIPDIKGEAHIVFERGMYYPHHNLYYITSKHWDLRALQAVLLSNIVRFIVSTYSVRMRGGYLRFQAQYLRRIRIPLWDDVSESMRSALFKAATERDLQACNRAVYKLYNLTLEEQHTLISLEDK